MTTPPLPIRTVVPAFWAPVQAPASRAAPSSSRCRFVDPVITSAPTSVSTPQGGSASSVTLRGTGLCPGSTVTFGNAAAAATAATVTSGAITVPVPRLATDGPITITSPAGRVLTTAPAQVRTYRNTNGFSFPNRGWSPNINGEVDAWGPNQVWLNLCPFPSCYWLADGTPSLEYAIFSAIAAPILSSGNGSCFGFSLASRRLARREGPTPTFLHGAETVWQVPLDRTIPHTEHFAFEDGHPEKLIDYIWGQHMLQLSSESLHALLVHTAQLAAGEISASDLHGQLDLGVRSGRAASRHHPERPRRSRRGRVRRGRHAVDGVAPRGLPRPRLRQQLPVHGR